MRVGNSFGLRLHYFTDWHYNFNFYDFKYYFDSFFILEFFLLLKLKNFLYYPFFKSLYKIKTRRSKKKKHFLKENSKNLNLVIPNKKLSKKMFFFFNKIANSHFVGYDEVTKTRRAI
jgi:hypothetical protein